SGAAEQAGDVLSFKPHDLHVCRTRSDVFGGGVTTLQRFDEASMRAQERVAIGPLVVADDDRLAAAEWQSGKRVLVSHAVRQAQSIGECVRFGFVMPKTRAADGWTKGSTVNGNDAVISACGLASDQNLLVRAYYFLGDLHESTLRLTKLAGSSTRPRSILGRVLNLETGWMRW